LVRGPVRVDVQIALVAVFHDVDSRALSKDSINADPRPVPNG
jgi:hypothetical protein